MKPALTMAEVPKYMGTSVPKDERKAIELGEG